MNLLDAMELRPKQAEFKKRVDPAICRFHASYSANHNLKSATKRIMVRRVSKADSTDLCTFFRHESDFVDLPQIVSRGRCMHGDESFCAPVTLEKRRYHRTLEVKLSSEKTRSFTSQLSEDPQGQEGTDLCRTPAAT